MTLRILTAFLLLTFSISFVRGQDSSYQRVYRANHKVEIGVPIVFFCGAYFGFKALDKYASFTADDVKNLNPESINAFDRPIAYYNPAEFKSAQNTSDLFLNIAVASPALLLLDKKIRGDWKDFLSMFLMAHLVDNTIYFSSVLSVRRPRPLTFNPNVPLEEKIGEGKSNSFFSGHTSWSATSTFLLVKIYTDYHHIKGFKRLAFFTGAAIPPAFVGYYRMEAGKHFKTDVITGFVIGATCGILIPELHRIKSKTDGLSFNPFFMQGASGLTVSYRFK